MIFKVDSRPFGGMLGASSIAGVILVDKNKYHVKLSKAW
jgi:hypothetical protein